MIPNRTNVLEAAVDQPATRGRIKLDIAVLAGALALFAFLALQMQPFVPDDSFISYRYAANLADGTGLRFNSGDAPVEGYSNFLWIVLLAMTTRMGADPVVAGPLLGSMFGGLTIVALWVLLRRLRRQGLSLLVPVGLLAIAAPLLLYAVSGMETPLFAFLLLVLILATEREWARPSMAGAVILGAVGFLLVLTRPEGIIALPIVLVCLVILARHDGRATTGHNLAVAASLYVVMLIGYHVWRVSYFEAFWPTPFLSKGATDGTLFGSAISNLRQFFVRQTHYYTPMAYYYAAIAVPAIVAAWMAWRRGESRPIEWTALILAAIFALVYLNFVDWMPGMRYYAPLIGLFLIPFSLLGPQLIDGNARIRDISTFLILGATLTLFSLSSLASLRLDSGQLQASTVASMVELGRWLGETMPDDTVLAMSDVGAIPYYSGLRTIDINHESLTDRTIAEDGWSVDYFFAVDPDVVILTAFSLTRPDFYGIYEELYAMPRFQAAYERIGVVRNDWYQDRAYWVFVRRGHAPSAEQMMTFPEGIRKP